jgi:phosphatidylinositol glycan class B
MRVLDSLRVHLPNTPVRRVVAVALAIQVLAAWFNGGRFNPDEHWQLLELARYKLGQEPASALPWEFAARMRPGLQPWLAAGVFVALDRLRAFTPFVAAFVLRLASGLLGLWVALELCARCLPDIRRPVFRQLAFLGTLFLWIAPFLRGRFASESWGGALAFAGVCLALDATAARKGRKGRTLALAVGAGFVWGLAFYCRFQVGFIVAGAVAWVLVIRRPQRALPAAMGVGFAVAVAFNTLVDHWLYGAWVLTPLRYWTENLVDGRASSFGTSPWWATALPFLIILVPPFSVAFLAVLLVGAWRLRRHVLVWAIAPFVLAHALVAHKEARFMYPLITALVPLLALSLDSLPERLLGHLPAWRRSRAGRLATRSFLLVNTLGLALLTVIPAHESHPVVRWLWDAGAAGRVRLCTLTGSPYGISESPARAGFYMPPNLVETKVTDVAQFLALRHTWPGERVLLFYPGFDPPPALAAAGVACVPVARTLPAFLRHVPGFDAVKGGMVSTLCEPSP